MWKWGNFRAEIVSNGLSFVAGENAAFLIRKHLFPALSAWAWAASDKVGHATFITAIQDSTLELTYADGALSVDFENITGDYRFAYDAPLPTEALPALAEMVEEE